MNNNLIEQNDHPVVLPVVLITGAARRIGKAIAEHLHQNQYQIILHCRNSTAEANELATRLNNTRAESCFVISSDLSTEEGCIELINQAIDKQGLFAGRLDALINNASAFYSTPLDSTSASIIAKEKWDDLFNSNLKAPFILAQKSIAALAQHNGSIINITDIHGEKPLKGYSVYSMSKAGLIAMTLSLAKELAPAIRVNAVSPGAILWPEVDLDDEEKQNKVLSKIPLKRMGKAMNIAQTVLFLLENDYITGEIIKIDGGRSL